MVTNGSSTSPTSHENSTGVARTVTGVPSTVVCNTCAAGSVNTISSMFTSPVPVDG